MSALPERSAAMMRRETRDRDLAACRVILAEGSKSFAAASLLLPRRVRAPAAAVYAFCRVSDDAVDFGDDPEQELIALHGRLQRIYAGEPDDDPVDRAFAEVTRLFRISKQVPLALLDGYRWDVEGRTYETLPELLGYCARVASSVGVMMTHLMTRPDDVVLARAIDLGLAMQLTNIARDVGEDARNGRIYLPLHWLREEGIDPQELLREPRFSPALGRVVRRLLEAAEFYYRRADTGISLLPADSRVSIRAARLIYADIGRVIAKNDYDSVSQRAYTSKARKIWLALRSLGALLWNRRQDSEPAARPAAFLARPQRPPLALPAQVAA